MTAPDTPSPEWLDQDYNRLIAQNVTVVAQADLPGTWIDPVSGEKLYNEAAVQAECLKAEVQLALNVDTQFRAAMMKQRISTQPPEGARFRTPEEELTTILVPYLAELQPQKETTE
jgi:hypothetical protein